VDPELARIGLIENTTEDFSKYRPEQDAIPGDVYEYVMRHSATESGKSKCQFYNLPSAPP